MGEIFSKILSIFCIANIIAIGNAQCEQTVKHEITTCLNAALADSCFMMW